MNRAPWLPSASIEALRARAALLRVIREFFHVRGVMEVDTPALSRHGTVDRHIDSFEVPGAGWLHTSPEFPMKRLLAAGSGPIFQMCHVFRAEPTARLHNPEFMMLEWYRPGWTHLQLMDEVAELVRAAMAAVPGTAGTFGAPIERHSYRDSFQRHAALDPYSAPIEKLRDGLARHGVDLPSEIPAEDAEDRDFWLDLLMGAVVGPRLGATAPCFVYDFPASQCALSRVRSDDPPVAERFELLWKGVELANGFHELTDPIEQRRRFEADAEWRRQHGKPTPPLDRNLLAALKAGMPGGAGAALGVDRLLMLLLGIESLAEVQSFDSARA